MLSHTKSTVSISSKPGLVHYSTSNAESRQLDRFASVEFLPSTVLHGSISLLEWTKDGKIVEVFQVKTVEFNVVQLLLGYLYGM